MSNKLQNEPNAHSCSMLTITANMPTFNPMSRPPLIRCDYDMTRVGHSVAFLKSWAQCHILEELGTVSHFGGDGHNVTFWKSWAQCYVLEEMGTMSHFGRVGHNVTFWKS